MDLTRLSPKERLHYHALVAWNRWTGRWRHPAPTNGDFETMTPADIVYWLYKAQFPVERAQKGSGLEDYFASQAAFEWRLPDGFVVENSLAMSAAGDLMDHPYLPRSSGFLYEAVAELLFGADLSMANLECVVFPEARELVIGTKESPPLVYRGGSFDAAKGIDGRRYSFLAAASNHSLDCGEPGVASTTAALRNEAIAFHGVNASEADAHAVTVVEKRGIRVGVLAHTFGLNGKRPPPDKPWLVNRTRLLGKLGAIDLSLVEAQLRDCQAREVDFVVAQLHWGLEHELYPRPDQLEFAHHLAELGVDLVLGHHPHVVQPVEHYRTRRDPDRVVPIYYSLGNLINPFSHPLFRTGAVARLELARGTSRDGQRRTYVKRATRANVFQEIDERHERLRLVSRASA